MKRKQGISLIVLVITIIVMIILAASVVLTLSNTGIINKANEAVEKTNIKEIEQLASIVWAEEFMNGKRGDTLKSAVLEKLKDYTDKYTITVTDTGVTVMEAGKLNEYGFYYDTVYSDGEYAVVAKKDGIVEWYYYSNALQTYMPDGIDEVTYEKGKIIFGGWEAVVSNNGKTLSDSAEPEAKLEYTNIEYHDVYYGQKYYNGVDDYVIITSDNTIKCYNDNECYNTIESSNVQKISHAFIENTNYSAQATNEDGIELFEVAYPTEWYVSIDGKWLIDNNNTVYSLMDGENKTTFTVSFEGSEQEFQFDKWMTWEEWINSSYNTIEAERYSTVYVSAKCACGIKNAITIPFPEYQDKIAFYDLIFPGMRYTILHD